MFITYQIHFNILLCVNLYIPKQSKAFHFLKVNSDRFLKNIKSHRKKKIKYLLTFLPTLLSEDSQDTVCVVCFNHCFFVYKAMHVHFRKLKNCRILFFWFQIHQEHFLYKHLIWGKKVFLDLLWVPKGRWMECRNKKEVNVLVWELDNKEGW